MDISSHYALNTNRGAALERLGRVDEAIEVSFAGSVIHRVCDIL